MHLTDSVRQWLDGALPQTQQLFQDLCRIPAPSGQEQKRAEFCKSWLEAQGAEGVYMDEALNVLYPVGCDGSGDIILFLAHTDTVFPDTEPMDVQIRDGRLYAPGSGDDTVCLAQLLMAAKYVAQNKLTPKRGVLFAANSCEEGLGNLKGIRHIMETYGSRIRQVYTFDGQYTHLVNRCVGSHRYRVTVRTEGGHSFNAFGKRNAIHAASQLICRLYQQAVPQEPDSKTTFNVGQMEGGTSVNTIAQEASFLYEYRSDSRACLEQMQRQFQEAVAQAAEDRQVHFSVELLGDRPCSGDVNQELLQAMTRQVKDLCETLSGLPCSVDSGSTDCNLPMSMGIPAVCVGSYLGGGAHTREEYVELSSVPVGLHIVLALILGEFQ